MYPVRYSKAEDALHNGSVEEFLLALRNVVRANQGMSKIASDTELGRESLYFR